MKSVMKSVSLIEAVLMHTIRRLVQYMLSHNPITAHLQCSLVIGVHSWEHEQSTGHREHTHSRDDVERLQLLQVYSSYWRQYKHKTPMCV